MTNRYVLIRNLAILIIACNLLFWLFPIPPSIWRLLLVVLAVIAMFNKKVYLPCEKIALVFVFFNLLYFGLSYINGNQGLNMIGNVLYGFLSLVLFSWLSEKGAMTEKALSIIGIILIVVSVLHYNYYDAYLINNLESSDVTTNSYSEVFMMLLPLLLLINKPIIKWSLLIVSLFFIILGAKRGNIVAAIIPILLIFYLNLSQNKRSLIRTFFVLLTVLGIILIAYYWVSSNSYLLTRIDQTIEGDSSNRDRIYSAAWHLWYDSGSTMIYLFGYGYNGVYNQLNVAAHNDWLEILVDYGLLGVSLYLLFYFRLMKHILITKDRVLKLVLISTFSIMFIKSLFSMSFNTSTLLLLMISMGTALGQYNNSTTT